MLDAVPAGKEGGGREHPAEEHQRDEADCEEYVLRNTNGAERKCCGVQPDKHSYHADFFKVGRGNTFGQFSALDFEPDNE